jgi:hypothetical protein
MINEEYREVWHKFNAITGITQVREMAEYIREKFPWVVEEEWQLQRFEIQYDYYNYALFLLFENFLKLIQEE